MQTSSGNTSASRRSRPTTRPTVLYRGEAATVTTASFESGGQRYPVAELDAIERVEHHGGWLRLAPRQFELRARFRGRLIQLFRSDSAREFGQVCRALARARELVSLTLRHPAS